MGVTERSKKGGSSATFFKRGKKTEPFVKKAPCVCYG